MPPRGDPSLLTERDQIFLVECIKNSKEKLMPDFDLVGQATSMSKKGAANKFRDIMKRFDAAAGTTWGENGAANKRPAAKRAKPVTTHRAATTETGSQDGEEEREEDEPPKKKANTAKTKAKAPAKSKPKAGAKKGVATKKAATMKSEEKVAEDSEDEAGESQDGEAETKDEEEGSV